MTNVPDTLRQLWHDVYVLFDTHYMMPNTTEAWDEYWGQVNALLAKYGDHLWDLMMVVTEMISDKMRETASAEQGG